MIVIRPSGRWPSLRLGDLIEYRDLLYFLAWRDVKVKYKQTALGVLWAVLQPLLTMILFSAIFGGLAKLPSDGSPYPVFTFAALLPWQLFSNALTQSGNSLVSNQALISKVYFPRLVIPIASVLAGLVDFAVSLVVLFVLMAYYGVAFTPALLTLPLLTLLVLATALAVGLWLSALNVHFRDVRYTLPFLTQLWLLASPVAYSSSVVPPAYRELYALNPMVGVIEGFRWALLGSGQMPGASMVVSSAVVLALLFFGLAYFRRMEATFADVV